MLEEKVKVIRVAMLEHVEPKVIDGREVGDEVAYSLVEALEMDEVDKYPVCELLAHVGLSDDDVENALWPVLSGLIAAAGRRLAQTRAHHVPEHVRETLIKVLTAAGRKMARDKTVKELLDRPLP